MRYYHVFIDTVLAHAALDAEALGLDDAQKEQQVRAWNDIYGDPRTDAHPNLRTVREHLPRMTRSAFPETLELCWRSSRRAWGSGKDGARRSRGADRARRVPHRKRCGTCEPTGPWRGWPYAWGCPSGQGTARTRTSEPR